MSSAPTDTIPIKKSWINPGKGVRRQPLRLAGAIPHCYDGETLQGSCHSLVAKG